MKTGGLIPTPSAVAHDAIAETYDEVFTNSVTGRAQRDLVWRELERCFQPGHRVLELDCGTGVDAAHLAENGVEVWACEESSGMLEVARRRITSSQLNSSVHLRLLSTSEISNLQGDAPFDGAFSDFGTLNCIGDMDAVARNLAGLLRPGAKAVLCMAGTCVAWEIVYFALKGRFRETFRRFGPGPTYVRLVDELHVACWYPSVRSLRRAFRPYFSLLRWSGVGVAIPPSYLEGQAKRFPGIMRALVKIDPWLGRIPLARGLADHLLLTFERSATAGQET